MIARGGEGCGGGRGGPKHTRSGTVAKVTGRSARPRRVAGVLSPAWWEGPCPAPVCCGGPAYHNTVPQGAQGTTPPAHAAKPPPTRAPCCPPPNQLSATPPDPGLPGSVAHTREDRDPTRACGVACAGGGGGGWLPGQRAQQPPAALQDRENGKGLGSTPRAAHPPQPRLALLRWVLGVVWWAASWDVRGCPATSGGACIVVCGPLRPSWIDGIENQKTGGPGGATPCHKCRLPNSIGFRAVMGGEWEDALHTYIPWLSRSRV